MLAKHIPPVTAAILGKYWRDAYVVHLSPDTVPHRIAHPFTSRPPFFPHSFCSTCSGGDRPDACTTMACVPCTTCEDNGETYCAGVTYLSSDGCNTCNCNENGMSSCTLMACPEPEEPEVACAADVQECADGSYASRDPANNCAFRLCPEEELACAMDVSECPDGTFASRDPGNNCEFKSCPEAPATCLINGIEIDAGETYTASDGCNTW